MTAEIQDRRPALPYAQRFAWEGNVEHDVLPILVVMMKQATKYLGIALPFSRV